MFFSPPAAGTLTVVIPAQSTASPQVVIQTGTIAGTLSGRHWTLWPAGHGRYSIFGQASEASRLRLAVPGITSVVATSERRHARGTVKTRGFSNTRQVLTAKFHFTPWPRAHQLLTTEDFTIDVSSLFTTWYADPASIEEGSEFTYTQTFSLSSDALAVGQVSVTLVNSVGGSAEATTP